ncbi:MAG: serine/threonine-protein kinase [Planctomycetota bacterium]
MQDDPDSEITAGPTRPSGGGPEGPAFGLTGERFSHYRILRELGRGGQGQVLLAVDERLERKVALKVLLATGRLSRQAVLRFEREAAAASRLDNPGIARVYEYGEFEGVSFIAYEYVPGRTLKEFITETTQGDLGDRAETVVIFDHSEWSATEVPLARESGTVSATQSRSAERTLIERVVRFTESAARALHAAHEVGLVHRDIKPGNLMLREDGSACLLDFGLAIDEQSGDVTLTATGEAAGTAPYMSPEQIRATQPLDRRTDVYSLGVTLFECCTLQRPFTGATIHEIVHAIQNREAPRPRRLNPQIPRDLEAIILIAMEKERDRRYATAKDLADDLRRFLELKPVVARPAGPMTRFVRVCRRNPVVSALILGIIAILTVSVVRLASLNRDLTRTAGERDLSQRTERRVRLDLAEAALAQGIDRLRQGRAQEAALLLALTNESGSESPVFPRLLGRAVREAARTRTFGLPSGRVPREVIPGPEGRILAALVSGRERPATSDLVLIDGDSGALLGGPFADVAWARFSPDGRRLVFRHEGGVELRILTVGDEDAARVLPGAGFAGVRLDPVDVRDPGGRGILLRWPDGGGIARLDPETGAVETLDGELARRLAAWPSDADPGLRPFPSEGRTFLLGDDVTDRPLVRWSEDLSGFLSGDAGGVCRWEADGRTPRRRIRYPFRRQGETLTPDGERLAIGEESGGIVVFETATGLTLDRFTTDVLDPRLAFSADGRVLAVWSDDAALFVRCRIREDVIARNAVDYSRPTGSARVAVLARRWRVEALDLGSSAPVLRMDGFDGAPLDLVASASGDVVVALTADGRGRGESGGESFWLPLPGGASRPSSLEISHDGAVVATHADDGVRVVDRRLGRQTGWYEASVAPGSLAPDGLRQLRRRDGRLELGAALRPEAAEPGATGSSATEWSRSVARVHRAAWSRAGDRFAVILDDGHVAISSRDAGPPEAIEGIEGATDLQFARDGRSLIVRCEGGAPSLSLVSLDASGSEVRSLVPPGEVSEVRVVASLGSGRWLLGDRSGRLRVVDEARAGIPESVATPTGEVLAIASSDDGRILVAGRGGVTRLRLDGDRLAIVGEPRIGVVARARATDAGLVLARAAPAIEIVDAVTGKILDRRPAGDDVTGVALLEGGRELLVAAGSGTRILDLDGTETRDLGVTGPVTTSAAGRFAHLAADGRVVDLRTLETRWVVPPVAGVDATADPSVTDVADDGEHVIRDGVLIGRDGASSEVAGWLSEAGFIAGGRRLAVSDVDLEMSLHDIASDETTSTHRVASSKLLAMVDEVALEGLRRPSIDDEATFVLLPIAGGALLLDLRGGEPLARLGPADGAALRARLAPGAEDVLLLDEAGALRRWPLPLIATPPAELRRWLRERTGWRLEGGRARRAVLGL